MKLSFKTFVIDNQISKFNALFVKSNCQGDLTYILTIRIGNRSFQLNCYPSRDGGFEKEFDYRIFAPKYTKGSVFLRALFYV